MCVNSLGTHPRLYYRESKKERHGRVERTGKNKDNNEDEDNMTGRFPLAIAHTAKAAKLPRK